MLSESEILARDPLVVGVARDAVSAHRGIHLPELLVDVCLAAIQSISGRPPLTPEVYRQAFVRALGDITGELPAIRKTRYFIWKTAELRKAGKEKATIRACWITLKFFGEQPRDGEKIRKYEFTAHLQQLAAASAELETLEGRRFFPGLEEGKVLPMRRPSHCRRKVEGEPLPF